MTKPNHINLEFGIRSLPPPPSPAKPLNIRVTGRSGNILILWGVIVFALITLLAVGIVFFNHKDTKGTKNNSKDSSVTDKNPQVSRSPNYRNELIRSDFVPAEPNHYWCDLGQTYLKHHNYQDAIESFNKALEAEKAERSPAISGINSVPTDVGKLLHQAEILYFLGASYQYNGKTAVSPALMRDNLAQAKTSFQNSITLYESIMAQLPDKPAGSPANRDNEKAAIKTKLAELYKVTGRNNKENE